VGPIAVFVGGGGKLKVLGWLRWDFEGVSPLLGEKNLDQQERVFFKSRKRKTGTKKTDLVSKAALRTRKVTSGGGGSSWRSKS